MVSYLFYKHPRENGFLRLGWCPIICKQQLTKNMVHFPSWLDFSTASLSHSMQLSGQLSYVNRWFPMGKSLTTPNQLDNQRRRGTMAVQSSEAPVIHLLSAENSPHLGGKRLRVVVDYFTWCPILRYSFIKCFWIPFNKGKRKNNEVNFRLWGIPTWGMYRIPRSFHWESARLSKNSKRLECKRWWFSKHSESLLRISSGFTRNMMISFHVY